MTDDMESLVLELVLVGRCFAGLSEPVAIDFAKNTFSAYLDPTARRGFNPCFVDVYDLERSIRKRMRDFPDFWLNLSTEQVRRFAAEFQSTIDNW